MPDPGGFGPGGCLLPGGGGACSWGGLVRGGACSRGEVPAPEGGAW